MLPADRIHVTAFLVLIRPIAEAAASRVATELASISRESPWTLELERNWQHWARTPGGVITALNATDQARVLSMAFHEFLQFAAAREIPIIFLSFPRIIHDWEYLHHQTSELFCVDRERAEAAHASVADASLVRTDGELAGAEKDAAPFSTLDRIALGREIQRLYEQLEASSRVDASKDAQIQDFHRTLQNLTSCPTEHSKEMLC